MKWWTSDVIHHEDNIISQDLGNRDSEILVSEIAVDMLTWICRFLIGPTRCRCGLMECLVHIFKQQFLVFKQHYTYFYTFFHPHIFPHMFSDNNFQFLSAYIPNIS